VRLGTRGSALALVQAGLVRDRLGALGEAVELVVIRTSGDERPGRGPAATEDKERFVKEIEDALLEGRVDLAVHSAKDVAIRPDLEVRELRGNVDTRLGKLADGDYDALVLAAAGLRRLGRSEGEPIPCEEMLPAPGQGCLALEARRGEPGVAELGAQLTDRDALVALTAERALVAGLDASCHTPVGAFARLDGDALALEGFAGTPDGGTWIRDGLEGPAPEPAALGAAVAERMLAAGAREVLDAAERMDAR
jgi:hydroxymethylbilane synthase